MSRVVNMETMNNTKTFRGLLLSAAHIGSLVYMWHQILKCHMVKHTKTVKMSGFILVWLNAVFKNNLNVISVDMIISKYQNKNNNNKLHCKGLTEK